MLRHIGRRAAIFAAEREALQQPQRDQQDRGQDADMLIEGQEADGKRRSAHHEDRDQEGVLAADKIPDPAEHDGTEWPHKEARGIGGKRRKQCCRIVALGKEQGCEGRCQDRVEIEVVPLEYGTKRGGEDDPPLLALGNDATVHSRSLY
jgi:hypothetical protein